MSEASMDFVCKFLADFDKYGIEDFYNKETRKMETSFVVRELVEQARKIAPAKLSKTEAGNRMRDLNDLARSEAIEASPEKVIDLRAVFAKKVADNGGTLEVLRRLVENPTAETVAEARVLINLLDGEDVPSN